MSRRQQTPMIHEPSAGTNRREVLLGAGGLAAVAAAMGGQVTERENLPGSQITGSIDGIGTFDVLDMSTGLVEDGAGGGGSGGSAGRVTFQDFQFVKVTDATTPKVLLACVSGRHIQNASFTYANRKGAPVIKYDLENVLVTSLSLDENTQDRPTETVMINFSKIVITVNGVSAGYDLGKGTTI